MTDNHQHILQQLANGVNPITGQPLPDTSPYNHPDVIRALFSALQHKPAQAKKAAPTRNGMPWSDEEREAIMDSYRSGSTLKEIAAEHLRTTGAIHSELVKCGVFRESEELTPP